jgi:hypothetical protein
MCTRLGRPEQLNYCSRIGKFVQILSSDPEQKDIT